MSAEFFFGLGVGLILLLSSALRAVSPRWLRLFLIGCLLPQAAGYLFHIPHLFMPASAGLLLCSIFAVDQLIRHPAMSAKKLLVWCSPVLVFTAATCLALWLAAQWISPWWQARLTESVVVLGGAGFIGWVCLLLAKVPSAAMRRALIMLAAAHALQAGAVFFFAWTTGRLVTLHADLALLLALWHAYDTACGLQVNR